MEDRRPVIYILVPDHGQQIALPDTAVQGNMRSPEVECFEVGISPLISSM